MNRHTGTSGQAAGTGWISEAALHGFQTRHDLPSRLSEECVRLIDADIAQSFSVIPLGRSSDGGIELAAASAAGVRTHLPELEFALGPIHVFAAEPAAVQALLARHYAVRSLPEIPEPLLLPAVVPEEGPATELQAELPGIASYVENLLGYAVRIGASDVHFEPRQEAFDVRMRVDGVLRALQSLPPAAGPAVLARLKVMAGLDLGISRKPQDGRINGAMAGRNVDIRLATLPTVCGECAVLRLLDASRRGLDLDSIGMPARCRVELERVCAGHGLVLACGPTGSGKTTTLHAALRSLDAEARKILTVEDPVEYELPGAVQVQARPELGLDFHAALRSFLRHDPDVMLVGEIRDAATARTAVRAAMTGHLVLASLHCAGAAEASMRLVDLGLEPWMVGSALELSIAQRLVRRYCPNCGGKGCPECNGTGFRGRVALFEWLRMNGELAASLDGGSMTDYLRQARAAMSATMADAGLERVRQGVTTYDEVALQVDLPRL